MTPPEFSRPQRIDAIGDRPHSVAITAEPGERAALAARFGLVSIDALAAQFAVGREAGSILVTGEVTAAVIQACVVTDDPVPTRIAERVTLRFVPEEGGAVADEIELADDALDTIEYQGNAIDLGEAAAETLALALDPFPRGPRAAEALREAGVIAEGEAGPFGALASLRDRLKS